MLQFLSKSQFNRIALLIPAYDPPFTLINFMGDIIKSGFNNIIVVDDGSRNKICFDTLEKVFSFTLLCHNVNLGKGAALKTGLRFVIEKLPDVNTVLTCDSDSQHSVNDILCVAYNAIQNKNMFVLGVRDFKGDFPARSKFGNFAIKWLLKKLVGLDLKDCQTGLRAFPKGIILETLTLKPNGYEFELECLVLAYRTGISFLQIPIETIYYNNNQSSHFHPVKDSFKILVTLLLSKNNIIARAFFKKRFSTKSD